jgi:NADH-quinone oxidoreductase subunit A
MVGGNAADHRGVDRRRVRPDLAPEAREPPIDHRFDHARLRRDCLRVQSDPAAATVIAQQNKSLPNRTSCDARLPLAASGWHAGVGMAPVRRVDLSQGSTTFGRLLWAPEDQAVNPYVVFLMYLLAILGFVFVTLVMNRYLGPKPVASALKLEPFECGATPVDTRNTKAVPIKYYAVAIAFMLFDLETIFLFVWALAAQPLTGFLLFTFFIFAFLLVLILLYVYQAELLDMVTE